MFLASVMAALSLGFATHGRQVCRHHLLHHIIEVRFMSPAEPLLCFGRVTDQEVDLGRTEVTWIDRDQHLTRSGFNAFFVDARTMPFNRSTDTSKGPFDELADRVPFAGCQHI